METIMPRDRKTDVHLSIPNIMLDSIDEQVDMGEYRNRTHAVLYYIRVGMRINEFKIKCDDPEFAKEVRADWSVEEATEWLSTMPEEQIKTIAKAWELTMRRKHQTQ
jgi:Arc/MetJ-type ribon-helix-helix transcriptional regulator